MNRRGFFGALAMLGAAVVAGYAEVNQPSVSAARRPTPTPRPVQCYGRKVNVGGVCVCSPDYPAECGPTCCETAAQCCDGACCPLGTICSTTQEEVCIAV